MNFLLFLLTQQLTTVADLAGHLLVQERIKYVFWVNGKLINEKINSTSQRPASILNQNRFSTKALHFYRLCKCPYQVMHVIAPRAAVDVHRII